jgi:hypothetical protein
MWQASLGVALRAAALRSLFDARLWRAPKTLYARPKNL